MSPKVVKLLNAVNIHGDPGIVAEIVTISPVQATEWLRANKLNRPVRRRHVEYLADEIKSGNWQLNGQAIIVSENEEVLDGQHRLLAIIEAGIEIKSMVVYGVSKEAFKTIDTGIVRSGADALGLHFTDLPAHIVKACSTAAMWCARLEEQKFNARSKMSNTDIIEYVNRHQTLVHCARTLLGYPQVSRPMPIGPATALFEMFSRKDEDDAAKFMERLFTGEGITRVNPEWLLRQAFAKDAERHSKFPITVRMRMVIKGWNWFRRRVGDASRQSIAVQLNDDQRITIF